ncbi:MAG: pentapeptide repeat-containing protein [Bacteroidota bacterium]|nr:pentapeptide repeat-containing protein [Bacteroidota bacterium]
MMLNSTSIGNKIATARKKINLSQAELAQQVSISSQAVGKWERGESMPDITTLNRLAEILGVDLNYFSESFAPIDIRTADTELNNYKSLTKEKTVSSAVEHPDRSGEKKLNWDMSKLNLVDSDFSGLKNLHEKFGSSNVQRCLFIGSNMSGLILNSNNIDSCDFTNSDISNSQIQSSNLGNNIFKNCSLQETEFTKSNINTCDFSDADLTKTTFRSSNFMKNTLTNVKWNNSSFIEMQIQDVVFEGTFDGCYFENCAFYDVKFQNATLINTFFKNNKKFKRVQFIDCKVDKITYAFLKSNQANLTGISLLS